MAVADKQGGVPVCCSCRLLSRARVMVCVLHALSQFVLHNPPCLSLSFPSVLTTTVINPHVWRFIEACLSGSAGAVGITYLFVYVLHSCLRFTGYYCTNPNKNKYRSKIYLNI